MAEKGWTAQVAAAAGVAAGTGAAQLGLGYGLGVVEWPALPAGDSVWLGSLGWATWIAASSTVFGAVIAGRLGRAGGGPWRFALAASAAVGALLTVALIALPARAAVRTDTYSPQTIAGGYAVIGVLLGLVIAYWAVVCRPAAANLIATAAWLWSLAAAAVAATIFWHRPSATYLSSWQFVSPDGADGQYGTIYWPSAALTLLAALVVGIIGALPAVRRGDLGVGAASSGAVGPLLVAAAFFALAPQLTGVPGPLLSAYLIAPYAVLAGLAGSALAVAFGQRRAARRAAKAAGRGASLGGASLGGAESAPGGSVARVVPPRLAPTSSRSRARSGSDSTAPAVATRPAPAASPATQSASPSAKATRPAPPSATATPPSAARPAAARPVPPSASPLASPPATRPAPPAAKATRSAPPSATAVAPAATEADPTGSGAAEDPEPQSRPRRSFMDRFRRKRAGQDEAHGTDDQSAVATGRAKAPAGSASPAPASAQSGSPSAGTAAVAAPSAATRGKPSATPPTSPPGAGSARAQSPATPAASTPGAASARAKAPAAPPTSPPSAASAYGKPSAAPSAGTSGAAAADGESQSVRPGGSPGATSARGKSSAASPVGTPRPGAASIDGGARPASSAPGRSDSRSTVAPPPDSPPIAKINEPQSGEKRPAPQKPTARPGAGARPGPANTASSDKTPPEPKTPAKSTKAAPAARPATPRQATSSRATGARAATPAKPASPGATAKEATKDANEADTAELPVQDPKGRGTRQPGEDETR